MTKRLLKDALTELLSEKEFGAVSVTDICTRADVNRSTFYAYYKNPRELLQELEDDTLSKIPIFSDDAPEITHTKQLQENFTDFFDYVKQNAALFRVLVLGNSDSDFSRRLVDTIFVKFKPRSKKKKTSLQMRYGYLYSISGTIGMMKDWLKNDFPLSPKTFAQLALKMAFAANNAVE